MTALGSSALTDEALLERFRSGRDERAFTLIVQRYADAVFATCLRILRDRARAEDATQETFFRLLRSPGAVEQSLGGWLHRAATTLCIDVIRREGRQRHWEQEHARRREQAIEASSWQELSPHVDEALAELPDEQRWVLVQHYLRGRTMRDLAAEIGSSAPTLSRRHQAALEALRDRLRKRGVMTSAAMLGTLLMCNAASAAAPITVTRELAKMSLVGAAASVEGVVGPPRWLATLGVLLAAGIGVGGLAFAWREWAPTPGVADESPRPSAAAPASAGDGPASFILLPDATADFDADKLAMVQAPATIGGDQMLTVVFRDNHVAALGADEVRRLVEAQTGRTLADLAVQQPIVRFDPSARGKR